MSDEEHAHEHTHHNGQVRHTHKHYVRVSLVSYHHDESEPDEEKSTRPMRYQWAPNAVAPWPSA